MDSTETLSWRTSSFSGANNECVEVADLTNGTRLVRDTKNRTGGTLHIGGDAWAAFLNGARNGEFD